VSPSPAPLTPVTSFGQLQAYYLTHQLAAYSKSDVAWIGSTQSTLTFLGSIAAGRYFDAHGPRALVVAGTALSIGALVGLAFCTEYYQFLLAHLLFGLSGTLTYSPATAISGHWFLRRRSTAVGVVVCGAGAGGVVYPLLMRGLFARLSFRDSILVIAGFNFVLMLPACVWMKARLPPRDPPPLRALKAPWKEAPYAFLVIGSAVYMLNVFSPYFNAPVLAANLLPPNLEGYAVALLQAGSFAGRAAAGVLADALGVWFVFGGTSFASAAVLFAFWTGAQGTAVGVLGLVTYGIVSGAWFTLVAAACASISPVCEIGMRLGMLWTLVGPPILAGPVVCGVLISADGGRFNSAGFFCGATMLLAAFLMPGPKMWAAVTRWGRRGQESGSAV
jgi:MFS family permease